MATVVMSGPEDQEVAQEAVSLGAQDYLVKGAIDARALDRPVDVATVTRSRVVAEGVESEVELDRLSRLRVRYPQGPL